MGTGHCEKPVWQMGKLRQNQKGGDMKRETEIDIAAVAAVGSKYDEACKRLFQNREIIAPRAKRGSTGVQRLHCG